MKKILYVLLILSFNASAAQFSFAACGEEWRIRHHDQFGELWLDMFDSSKDKWIFTVNRIHDIVTRSTNTPEQFMFDFLSQVNNKLTSTCESNNVTPVLDWTGQLKFIIENNLEYIGSTNEVVIK